MMIKSELIKVIAKKMTHLPIQTIDAAVNLILEQMTDALKTGQRIDIRNFGAFTVQAMPERPGHNPITGEKVVVPSKRKVHFKPGLGLKQRLFESQTRVAIEAD